MARVRPLVTVLFTTPFGAGTWDSSKEGGADHRVEKIWMDGEWWAWHDAQIHVLPMRSTTAAALRGHPGVRTPRGAAVGTCEHLKRCSIREAVPHRDPVSREAITQATKDVILANRLEPVRPPARAPGYGGWCEPLEAPVNVVIAVWPWGAYLGERPSSRVLHQGQQLASQRSELVACRRQGDRSVLNSVLAKWEPEGGYDERSCSTRPAS